MQFGDLTFTPALSAISLVASPVDVAIEKQNLEDVLVSSIDDSLADTSAFCDAYDVGLDVSANCVIVEAKRADKSWFVACMILATDRIDVNNIVRRHLDARKISFASMDTVINQTGMEYGGITPIGLPDDWQILVDSAILDKEHVIIGSGIRGSKLLVPSKLFNTLPNVEILDIKKYA